MTVVRRRQIPHFTASEFLWKICGSGVVRDEEDNPATAVIDTIRFASGDNPLTEISLRTGRGAHLNKEPSDEFVEEENTGLPIIVGGANASGKTSMLRGIAFVCDLLQENKITKERSSEVWSQLKEMGIRELELQFGVEIGRSLKGSMGLQFGRMTNSPHLEMLLRQLPVLLESKLHGLEEKNAHLLNLHFQEKPSLVLENLLQIKMNSNDPEGFLRWRDGLRLRRVGASDTISKMYERYGNLYENKNSGLFRGIKTERSINHFLTDIQGKNVSNAELEKFNILQRNMSRYANLKFQKAVIIQVDRVDREGSKETITKLRTLIPQVAAIHSRWKENPELLREQLLLRMENNQLFSDLGMTASDIVYSDRNLPGYSCLHDYAPDIVKSLMMKPDNTNFYTWYGEYAWETKQEAIDFTMEGCVHDIVYYVTGQSNHKRILIGDKTGYTNRNGPVHEVKWVDRSDEFDRKIVWEPRESLYGKSSDSTPSLSEVLRELPLLSNLLGFESEDSYLVDVLVRFNAFTSIEKIHQPYLSSGQQQVLALITAVRSSDEGSLILVDEPEISLHVDWQERLVEQLHAPLVGSRLFITTHSPDIVVRHRHLCTTLLVNQDGGFYRS